MDEAVGKIVGGVVVLVIVFYALLIAIGVMAIIFAFLTLFLVKANNNFSGYQELFPTVVISVVFAVCASGLIGLGSCAMLIGGAWISVFVVSDAQMELQFLVVLASAFDFGINILAGFLATITVNRATKHFKNRGHANTVTGLSFPIGLLFADFAKSVAVSPFGSSGISMRWFPETFLEWISNIVIFDWNMFLSLIDFDNWLAFAHETLIRSRGNIFELEPLMYALVIIFMFFRWLLKKGRSPDEVYEVDSEAYATLKWSLIIWIGALSTAFLVVPPLWEVGGFVSFIAFVMGAAAWLSVVGSTISSVIFSFILTLAPNTAFN